MLDSYLYPESHIHLGKRGTAFAVNFPALWLKWYLPKGNFVQWIKDPGTQKSRKNRWIDT
jgi:hypothetical protein